MDTPLFRHAANYTGRDVRPVPPVYMPERVAEAVVHLAAHPRAEVATTPVARLSRMQFLLAPRLTGRLLSWWVEHTLVGTTPAAPTEGALFTPVEAGTGSRDGWLQQQRLPAIAAAVAAGCLIVAGTGATRLLRKSS